MAVPTPAVPSPGGWRRFAVAACAFALATVGFATWLDLKVGGDQVTIAVDDVGEALAALVAATLCALAARRSRGQLRRAWALIAAAAASWCAGEVVWSIYEVGLGSDVPYPGLPDIGFLLAVPLTVAGVVSFGHTSRGTSVGPRLWLDRAIVALALLSSAWSLGLNSIAQFPTNTWLEKALNLAYPIGDIAIGTVLILAIRRATDETQGRLFLLLGGLAANAAADSAFSYLNATGAYGAIGSELDTGWVAGYLMIALAALWPSGATDRSAEEKPIDIWQLALPWLAILIAAIVLISGVFRHQQIDVFETVMIGLLAVLLMISQVAAHNESLSLLVQSRLSAATLNEVIVNAPLGVVRLNADLTILQANPSFAAMLNASLDALNGASLSRYFAGDELEAVKRRLDSLAMAATDVSDFDSQATRGDGSNLWLHWTATAVHGPTGELDYFLVMFEDVSARRAAEDVAAANLEVLQRLNRMKTQFLTKVSHEFRTALVGIQGFSEFIREAETLDVADVKSFANDIYEDARRLNTSLNQMLDLDAEQTSRAALHLEDTDMSRLVADAVAEFNTMTHKHTFVTALDGHPHVHADPALLHQVMRALLGRAVTYSPDGSVIDVGARMLGEEVRVSVTDHGTESPADLEAQLIGHAGDGALERVTALATGVGLPVARQIVEMHGGRLWFESGRGTVLSFSLPVSNAGGAG